MSEPLKLDGWRAEEAAEAISRIYHAGIEGCVARYGSRVSLLRETVQPEEGVVRRTEVVDATGRVLARIDLACEGLEFHVRAKDIAGKGDA